MTSLPFDNRVPRTPDAVNQLLSERPPGWPYLLYSAVLSQGIANLEDKFRDHEIGYAAGTRVHFSDDDAYDELSRQMDILQAIVAALGSVFDPVAQRRAMGASGSDGVEPTPPDADRTMHLARRLVTVYEELLDWAAGLRRTSIRDENLRRAAAIQAHFVDQPLEAIRGYAQYLVEKCDNVVAQLLAGENIVLESTITLELPPLLIQDRTEAIRAWSESSN